MANEFLLPVRSISSSLIDRFLHALILSKKFCIHLFCGLGISLWLICFRLNASVSLHWSYSRPYFLLAIWYTAFSADFRNLRVIFNVASLPHCAFNVHLRTVLGIYSTSTDNLQCCQRTLPKESSSGYIISSPPTSKGSVIGTVTPFSSS